MNIERPLELDEATENALRELKEMIAQRYPDATFDVVIVHGRDPEGVYLEATVDLEDVDEVLDVVSDRLFDIQVEQGLPIYVIPLQPIERVIKEYSLRNGQPG